MYLLANHPRNTSEVVTEIDHAAIALQLFSHAPVHSVNMVPTLSAELLGPRRIDSYVHRGVTHRSHTGAVNVTRISTRTSTVIEAYREASSDGGAGGFRAKCAFRAFRVGSLGDVDILYSNQTNPVEHCVRPVSMLYRKGHILPTTSSSLKRRHVITLTRGRLGYISHAAFPLFRKSLCHSSTEFGCSSRGLEHDHIHTSNRTGCAPIWRPNAKGHVS